jgi:hypothetical protein
LLIASPISRLAYAVDSIQQRKRHFLAFTDLTRNNLKIPTRVRPRASRGSPRLSTSFRYTSTMAPIPKQMFGILIEKVGGPEVLTWKENLLVPELKEGEVLVKNEFIGVNYIET